MKNNIYSENDRPEMINQYPMLREFSRTIWLRKVLRFGVPWFYYDDIEEELKNIYEDWKDIWLITWLLIGFFVSNIILFLLFTLVPWALC